MSVSTENKQIAQLALKAFGGKPKVTKYWDDNKKSSIDILLSNDNQFDDDVFSFSTLGLSDYSIGYESNELPIRMELVGASDFECFPNVLSTCAFYIINSNYKCFPGAIFENVVSMYLPNSSMKHILFVNPYLWENKFETVSFEKKQVSWLMTVPISEGEKKYAEKYGADALEDLFEEKQINVFDLERISLI
ncbi:suppressor of fused domain protein (plasmid) [Bacillus mycoides]|uniref:suppressor of fused domain protein n=1 Tax=Bacillus TaxID=1386 RepID=UPI000DC2BE6F|nr:MULTISPECIES: suppressor of fused domain protein [Bacillus]MED1042885.1 suppressor of fused domain protein [Bacillus mycoides]QWI41119.1 suppressor of fused domain protein [Bacillus mycoides]RAN66756.1 hypothetical protein B5P40_29000 [Bacillus sp. SRB_8]WJE67848.1 suppressor of fused domain protein [Bacillus mycoides]WJE74123.1 suppressor of fused domain protein [Bacillus mycoides]